MAKHQTKAIFLYEHKEEDCPLRELELQIPKPGAAKEMVFAVPEELPQLWATIVASKRPMRASSIFLPLGDDEAVQAAETRTSKKTGKTYGYMFTPDQIKAHHKRGPVAFVLSYGNFSQPRLDVHLTERSARRGGSNAQASTTLKRVGGNIAADPREKLLRVNETLKRHGLETVDAGDED